MKFQYLILCGGLMGLVNPSIAQNLLSSYQLIRNNPEDYGTGPSKSGEVFNNPAALSRLNHSSIALVAVKPLQIEKLNVGTVSLGVPFFNGVAELRIDYAGWTAYQEWQSAVGYALPLGKNLTLGARVHLLGQNIKNNGGFFSLNAGLGIRYTLLDKAVFGIYVNNPLGNKDGYSPFQVYTGAGYEVNPGLLIAIELKKEEDKDLLVQFMLAYHPLDRLYIEVSTCSGLSPFVLELGYRLKKLKVMVSGSFHQFLGYTPGMGLFYLFKNS